jgi:hypothetical protein
MNFRLARTNTLPDMATRRGMPGLIRATFAAAGLAVCVANGFPFSAQEYKTTFIETKIAFQKLAARLAAKTLPTPLLLEQMGIEYEENGSLPATEQTALERLLPPDAPNAPAAAKPPSPARHPTVR